MEKVGRRHRPRRCTQWRGLHAGDGVRSAIDRQDAGAAHGDRGYHPFRYDHRRAVLIGCSGSVAEKYALFPVMS